MTTKKKPANAVLRYNDGVSIRDYVDLRFEEAQRAIDKAEASMRERLAGMNEFRDQLKDQAGRFVTRDEMNIIITKQAEDIKALQKISDRAEGKASQNAMLFAIAMALIGLVLGVLNLFVR